jgi:hypothetical protein
MKAQYGVDAHARRPRRTWPPDFGIERAGSGPHWPWRSQQALWRRQQAGLLRARDRAGDAAAEEGRARGRRHGRASARHHAWRRWPSSRAWCGRTARVTAGNASRRERRRLRAAAGQRSRGRAGTA